MKREKRFSCQWVGWLMLAAFLAGCAVPATMRIRSFPDPETALLEYTRFALKAGDEERPLEEIHILKMVKAILMAKGFVEDTQKPQFHVQAIFGQEPKEEIEAIRTYTTERPIRRIRRSDGTYRYIYGGERTYVEGGGTKRYNARHIRLRFFDAEISAGKPIWEGEAISNGRSDLITVTPCLLEGLLEAFPHGVGVVVKKFDDRCVQKAAVY